MPGILRDDIVTVDEQKDASTLYNRGNYGYPKSGGALDLDLIEATYLMESKRLEVFSDGRTMTFEEMFDHSSDVHDDFDIRYMVYRDIRQRGFVIKDDPGDFDFLVYPRGKILSNSRPQYAVRAVSERTAFPMSAFADEVDASKERDRQLLYAVVDEEGDLTYYVISSKEPTGHVAVHEMGKVNGRLIRDRVFIFDTEECERTHTNGFFGKPIEGMLQLSLIESCYLIEKGMLNVRTQDGNVDADMMKGIGADVQNEFPSRLRTFRDLRDRGLLVKTGFKYGTHFRVYEKHPDKCHARYLVHCVSSSPLTWPDISRTVRLAHGVKKEILFSTPSGGYVEFRRFRP